MGRLSFPLALFAYPFYLWKRSPGKEGSHFDPACDLFVPSEKNMARPCRDEGLTFCTLVQVLSAS